MIGIVASRLVERFNRPVVLIAGTDGDWKGSGRSIPSFDLHGALGACSEHLSRFGGHRAAAGLSIDPAKLGAFAEAFGEAVDAELPEEDLQPRIAVDAVVSGEELTLDLSTELGHLAPFGLGNPGVTLLLPSCDLSDVAQTADGKHLRFRVRHRDRPAGSAIAFGLGRHADRARREVRHDVLFRLEENRWNGTVAPQLVVRQILETPERHETCANGWARSSGRTRAPGMRPRRRSSTSSGWRPAARGGSCSSRTGSGPSGRRAACGCGGGLEGATESRSVLRCSRRARESRLASNQASARIVRR